jgi:hypothetical protein
MERWAKELVVAIFLGCTSGVSGLWTLPCTVGLSVAYTLDGEAEDEISDL